VPRPLAPRSPTARVSVGLRGANGLGTSGACNLRVTRL